ncbi:hypothetical protein BDV98DRAFT_506686, partial [Pterulicium gracile]
HQRIGLALLILYIFQLMLGAFIHFVKLPRSGNAVQGRPLQHYLHAVLRLLILGLAAYQVHYRLTIEWYTWLGGLQAVPDWAETAWTALVTIFWACYFVGLALLPRQWRQEQETKRRVFTRR